MLSLPAILGLTAIATATGYVSKPSVGDVESVGWQLAYIIGIASMLGVFVLECWQQAAWCDQRS
ncbi:MAG: hypothetical protein AUG50_06415 [Betaproteobacteria bacterium 13_1_20CM_3_63_8]|nr:MAG: hypothetical protein AUG50_06415 [Betaproteobacteria bacterium 13_1_20CM_3_63_8]